MKKIKLTPKTFRVICLIVFLAMTVLSIAILFVKSSDQNSVAALSNKMDLCLACFIFLLASFLFAIGNYVATISERLEMVEEKEKGETDFAQEHDQGL